MVRQGEITVTSQSTQSCTHSLAEHKCTTLFKSNAQQTAGSTLYMKSKGSLQGKKNAGVIVKSTAQSLFSFPL